MGLCKVMERQILTSRKCAPNDLQRVLGDVHTQGKHTPLEYMGGGEERDGDQAWWDQDEKRSDVKPVLAVCIGWHRVKGSQLADERHVGHEAGNPLQQ